MEASVLALQNVLHRTELLAAVVAVKRHVRESDVGSCGHNRNTSSGSGGQLHGTAKTLGNVLVSPRMHSQISMTLSLIARFISPGSMCMSSSRTGA